MKSRAVPIEQSISTHALTEGDPAPMLLLPQIQNFNSRPHGGRLCSACCYDHHRDISTHALTEGDRCFALEVVCRTISTHALTEGDATSKAVHRNPVHFNSRPHGGRRTRQVPQTTDIYFNSRPHGGRHIALQVPSSVTNFNSRPHGGRLDEKTYHFHFVISTHALTEGDGLNVADWLTGWIFQLTPSRRAASAAARSFRSLRHFNSRPHGGRRVTVGFPLLMTSFQLTPSRRATTSPFLTAPAVEISTHALTEGDVHRFSYNGRFDISTHALTEGDCAGIAAAEWSDISTHALTEGDFFHFNVYSGKWNFNSRPHGGRQGFQCVLYVLSGISTHALTEGDRKFR